MNFRFVFWKSAIPLEDDEAYTIYRSLLRDGGSGGVQESVDLGRFLVELEKLYESSESGGDRKSPWATPPRAESSHVQVVIKSAWLWEVWPIVDRLAKQFELVYFDPQQYVVFLPRRLSAERSRLRKKRKHVKRTGRANRPKPLPSSKYPPRIRRPQIPTRVKIRREKDFHTDVAGVYGEGRQFLGFTLFLGSGQRRPTAVLHHFDADGNHVGSERWEMKNIAEAKAALAAAVGNLPNAKRRNIAIKPFQVQFGKTKFGLSLRKDGESFEYRPYGLVFGSPWDGTYDT